VIDMRNDREIANVLTVCHEDRRCDPAPLRPWWRLQWVSWIYSTS